MVKKYKVPVKGSEWRELTFEELTAITNDIERNVGDVLNSIKNQISISILPQWNARYDNPRREFF